MPDAVNQPVEEAAAKAIAPSRPELLAPAGDWECAKAAVENGADAIYFGLDRFNARMRAHNFTEADLPKLMEFLHRRGVRGYVTFNTLVFANELADAEQYLRGIIAAGVDAAIVQDIGIARLIRQLSPDFPIHASTQMTITSAAGVEFAKELGCNLVVLARECSLKDIEAIQKSFEFGVSSSGLGSDSKPETRNPKLPLEVFVHGALCVAYSGQCLTSESLGGRSANRGECAQACRMPYELVSDGKTIPLGDRKYLLSPQDLAGLEVLPELVRSGVKSLKIEGRLKTPEYVANITRVYRNALDQMAANDRISNPQSEIGNRKYDLEMAFSRGLYSGWFRGINNQELVHARFGKKRGVFLGEVTRVERDRVRLRLVAPLKAGDGVVFDCGHPEEDEEGGRVFAAQGSGEIAITFMPGAVNFARVHVGDKVWKTSDPELDRELRQTFSGDTPRFQRPIALEVHGHAGAALTLIARDELGHIARAVSTMPLARAEKQPLTTEKLREQLGRLGGTPFRLGELKNLLEGEIAARLPANNVTEARGLIGQVTAGIAGQKGKAADVGTLTATQNKNLQTLRTWMSRARQTATLAFPGQTVKLHEEFQVGVSTPTDLASILSRADIILAAVKKADNLATLKLKGWLEADTTAFETARGKLGTSDVTQEAAKSGAKDATGSRNRTANDLYDHLMTIQNAADLQWPADNPANAGVRDEFRINTFPPRGGSSGGTASPAPPKTPAT